MKVLVFIILSMTTVIAFTFSSSATKNYHKESIDFSVDSIRDSLESNYQSIPGCNHHDFQQVAGGAYHYLKDTGKGNSVSPLDCGGREIKFHNNGTDYLDMIRRDEVKGEAQE